MLKPCIEEYGMPGLRVYYNRRDVIAKNKFAAVFSVEQEKKLMLGMRPCYPFHCFKGKPAYSF